jgi:hypothetical protein
MVYQDLKESLDTDPARNVLKYLAFDVQPELKAREVGRKIWQYYFKNDSLSYGTNFVKLAEVWTVFLPVSNQTLLHSV